jgi:hypothetical protein
MTGKLCHGKRHTPITSEAQRGLFGSELARRRAGKRGRMKGITQAELESHLHEAGGKSLPKRSRKAKGRTKGRKSNA